MVKINRFEIYYDRLKLILQKILIAPKCYIVAGDDKNASSLPPPP